MLTLERRGIAQGGASSRKRATPMPMIPGGSSGHYGPPDGAPDPGDFGADAIAAHENWRNSGYTHYTAYKADSGQISWNEIELEDSREVEDVHISDLNIPDD